MEGPEDQESPWAPPPPAPIDDPDYTPPVRPPAPLPAYAPFESASPPPYQPPPPPYQPTPPNQPAPGYQPPPPAGGYPPPPYSSPPPSSAPGMLGPEHRYGPVPSVPLGGYGHQYLPRGAMPAGPPSSAPPPPSYTAHLVVITKRERILAVVGVVGAVMMTIGTFVPWVTADTEGGGIRTGNGWSNVLGSVGWGPFFLLLALVTAACFATTIVEARIDSLRRVAVGAAVLAVLTAAYQFFDLLGVHRVHIQTSIEVGPFVVFAGALLTLLVSAMGFTSERPANVTPPRAVGAVG